MAIASSGSAGAYVERMQAHGYLEMLLTVGHSGRVTFRNLGWSGDTVFGDARAVFGKRQDGFKRLVGDVTAAKPTVIIVAYGANEAHAGKAGLPEFEQGAARLFDSLKPTGARFIVLLPYLYGEGLARPSVIADFNAKLSLYRQSMRRLAHGRGYPVLDLEEVLGPITPQAQTERGEPSARAVVGQRRPSDSLRVLGYGAQAGPRPWRASPTRTKLGDRLRFETQRPGRQRMRRRRDREARRGRPHGLPTSNEPLPRAAGRQRSSEAACCSRRAARPRPARWPI